MTEWPVGTPEERAASRGAIPGQWDNSNPFGNWYEIAPGVWNYHDGVDLNLNTPDWNADWHKPIYAMADGLVYFAGIGGGSWGHIVDIAHIDPLTGRLYFSRCGHVENPRLVAGEYVMGGQQIAQVGNGDGWYGQSGAHLHFNICVTHLMLEKPNQWCGTNEKLLRANYVDPVGFIKARYGMVQNIDTAVALREALAALPADTPVTVIPGLPPVREPLGTVMAYVVQVQDLRAQTPPSPETKSMVVTATDGLFVRKAPVNGDVIGGLAYGTAVNVVPGDTPDWLKIADGAFAGGFVSAAWLSETPPK